MWLCFYKHLAPGGALFSPNRGYFIYPSQLFENVARTANTNPNLRTDLKSIFDAIESSANGYPSESDIKGLFADFDTTSSRLGNTVENKNSRLHRF